MDYIAGWHKKKLKCSICGSGKSVKYMHNGEPHCNSCMMTQITFPIHISDRHTKSKEDDNGSSIKETL